MTKTKNIGALFGSVSPMTLPNGINPVFKPSINIAKPIITAIRPKQIVTEEEMGCLKIRS